MATAKMTKAQRMAQSEMVAMLLRFEWDMAHQATRDARIPREWKEVWEARQPKKKKVSFYVDEDVWKLFHAMGPGYGPRMNTVLRSFVRARLAGLLDGEDLPASYREFWMGRPKPSLPQIEAEMEDVEEMQAKR
ncbi:MAG: BrnA antitoxin family protein [Pseudomonadota bacterium]